MTIYVKTLTGKTIVLEIEDPRPPTPEPPQTSE